MVVLDDDRGRGRRAAAPGPWRSPPSTARASVVVSGAEAAVARERAGRRLRVSHAFHSPLVEPMLAAYAEVAATVEHRPPTSRWSRR